MAYAAVVSLTNTIDRFLNSNLYSISLEEKQMVTSLLEYVTPFQHFLDEFPDKFNILEEGIKDLANVAEDILECLVLEKVFLCAGEESERYELDRVAVIKDFRLKQEKMLEEFSQESANEALKGRIKEVANAAMHISIYLKWEEHHSRYREKWRFLPAEFAKFKPKRHFIDHLNKLRNEIDSITEEMMAAKSKGRSLKCFKLKFKSHMKRILGKEFDSMKKNNKEESATEAASSSGIDEEEEEDECYRSEEHELELKRVMEEIALIAAQVKQITHSSSSKDVERGGADSSAALSSSSTAPPTQENSMVGLKDYVLEIKDRLCGEPSQLQVIPICGMGGIGKTTLAKKVYGDPLIVGRFDVRVWVTVSQDYSAQRILSSLVESLKEFDTGRLGERDDEIVHKILKRRRYLVVMDDIWSGEAWDVVRMVLPEDGNGSRVILTTRLSDVASYPDPSSKLYQMSLLNVDHCWNLFKQKVFADEYCPYELENIGKEIARRCKGLPLAVVVIAGLVSTASRSVASWQEIAENVKYLETTEHDQIEEILSLSYVQLPQYLRPCFLYMASFPEDHEIHVKKLIRLWIAEGFIKSPTDSDSFEKVAEECLEELVKRNLVLVTKRKCDGRIKCCSLHDLMRDLCIRKAHESKFFLRLTDQRFGRESALFSSLHGSTIRSIRCSRNNPLSLSSIKFVRLLRVLDAEGFHVYGLPRLDELFHLRYLAITSSVAVSSTSLSMLQNLQTLVIHTDYHFGDLATSVLVLTQWMSQLRHVYYRGTISIYDPEEADFPLNNLQTLAYVSHSTCRERTLKMIPNLKRLVINCSIGLPSDGGVFLDGLVHLHRLEDLEIYAGRQLKYYKITFPRMLQKLILRRWRLPWNDIFVFGSFPNLQVLKLIECDCIGGTWETTEGTFPVLEVLKISYSSFENWATESSHLPRLKLLLLDSCRDLNWIPNDIGEIPTLELIEVKGIARKSLIESVELIRDEQEDMGNNTLQVVCTAK